VYRVTWDRIDPPQTILRAKLRNAAVFAIWFVFGSRFADRFARRS
jgi:hypothetical protein